MLVLPLPGSPQLEAECHWRLNEHGLQETEDSITSETRTGNVCGDVLPGHVGGVRNGRNVGWRIYKVTMTRTQNIFVALALVVIFGLASVAVWRSQVQPAQTHGSAEHSNIDRNQNEKESVWAPSTYEPITTLTVALVVVTAIQAGLFFVQLRFMRDGIADAKDAAQAAIQGNKISRENFIAGRRAWLSIEKVALKQKTTITENTATFVMEIIIRNVGETPPHPQWSMSRPPQMGDGQET